MDDAPADESSGDPFEDGVVMVEFGSLSTEQMSKIDLHPLRALGADEPSSRDGGTVVAFWLTEGRPADDLLDEIKGWSFGNGLPFRGQVET
jgi:hypothetical protein